MTNNIILWYKNMEINEDTTNQNQFKKNLKWYLKNEKHKGKNKAD